MGFEQQENSKSYFKSENDLNGLWMCGAVAAGDGAFGLYIAALLSHATPVDATKYRMSFAVEYELWKKLYIGYLF